jgi:hypothetical protein
MTRVFCLLVWVGLVLAPLAAHAEEDERREPRVYVPTTFSLTASGGAATSARRFVAVDAGAPEPFPTLSTGYHVFATAGYRPTFGISEVWWRQRLAFELAFSHAGWSGEGTDSANYMAGMVGAKLDLLVKTVRPWVAQHAGFGAFNTRVGDVHRFSRGLAIRFAAGADYAFSSFLRAGLHGAWQHTTGAIIGNPTGQDWYEVGATLGGGF